MVAVKDTRSNEILREVAGEGNTWWVHKVIRTMHGVASNECVVLRWAVGFYFQNKQKMDFSEAGSNIAYNILSSGYHLFLGEYLYH